MLLLSTKKWGIIDLIIYYLFILVGLIVPFFSTVCCLFDGFKNLISSSFYIKGVNLIPLSINSICLFLLVFGGMCLTLTGTVSPIFINILSLVFGYISAVIIQTFVDNLRKK